MGKRGGVDLAPRINGRESVQSYLNSMISGNGGGHLVHIESVGLTELVVSTAHEAKLVQRNTANLKHL